MSYTVTYGTGSNVAAGTNPTPTYPASGMGAGKLAILVCSCQNGSTNDYLDPRAADASWTQQDSYIYIGAELHTLTVFSRELTGSETAGGTFTVPSSGSLGRRACLIFVIDTAGGTGWNFESKNPQTQATATTTITDRAVTTGGSARLAVNIISYPTRQTGGQEDFAGETGGSWVASGYYESGSAPTLSVQVAEIATAGTIDGGTDTSITSSPWLIFGFSVWRNATALPDLTVTDIAWDVAPAVGKPVILSAVITNAGTASSPNGVIHGVKFEVSGVAVAFSTSRTTSIAASGIATVYADSAWIPSASGTPNVVATVDYSALIAEANEANNTRTEAVTIIDLPNLAVTDITYTPAVPVIGDNVVFSAVVNNGGLGATPGSTVHKVNFTVSGVPVATSTSRTTSIAAAANATVVADAAWIPGSAGTFSVVATVDPDNIIAETNDGNNTYSENITIGTPSTASITKFAGRGPNAAGEIWPLLGDYDPFFLTQGEGDARYLQSVPVTYLTQSQSDVRYLQTVPAEYLTQTEADAQGMPAIEAGGVASNLEMREVNANFTLLAASSPRYYWQSYRNIGPSSVTVSAPAGYTTDGDNIIAAGTSALFVKRAGSPQFIRWN